MRIIMKNSPVMKSAVTKPAICDSRSECACGLANMSSDQMRMGRVSSRERRMPRGAGRTSDRVRASVAICFFPQEQGDSQREVIEGYEHHRHPSDCYNGLVAGEAAQR